MKRSKAIPRPADPFEETDPGLMRVALNTAIMMRLSGDGPMHDQVLDLNHHERLYLAVDIFDSETFNDGIQHFFWYDCGDLFDYALQGLLGMGINDVADSLQTYVRTVFGDSYPLDMAARQDVLARDEPLSEKADDMFGGYYESSQRVETALLTWARRNRSNFRVAN
jgi:hypothetical protein